jgi:hypothetical protein
MSLNMRTSYNIRVRRNKSYNVVEELKHSGKNMTLNSPTFTNTSASFPQIQMSEIYIVIGSICGMEHSPEMVSIATTY